MLRRVEPSGKWNLTAPASDTLEIAYGSGGMSDTYSAEAAICSQALTLYVGALPPTGSNARNLVHTALWFTVAGVLLAVMGVRRRRPVVR